MGKLLTVEEIEQFIEQGFLVVQKVFSRELVEQILPTVWRELDLDPTDRSKWTSPVVTLKKVLENPPFSQVLTERYLAAIDDLCGADRWVTTKGAGYWPISLPGFGNAPWSPPQGGWHIDIDLDHPHIESPDFGLINIEFYSDIEHAGGATVVRVGSHASVTRMLAEASFDSMNGNERHIRIASGTLHLSVAEIVCQTGDVLLMHPFTVHAASSNLSNRPRIAAVKLIRLRKPLNLSGEASEDHSPVERSIIHALNS